MTYETRPSNDIASRLTIGPRTVATHVDHILTKMSVPGRTAAATIALDEGLILCPLPGGEDGFGRLDFGRSLAAGASTVSGVRGRAERPLQKQPLRVGAALPLLGDAAQDGLEMLRGTQLAIEEINRRGGINMRPIELVVARLNHLDAATIRPALDELADAGVHAVTSGYLGQQDLAHEWAADYGRPYLNAATLSEMGRRVEREPRYRRIFQVCPGDSHYGPRFVRYMTELRERGLCKFVSRELVVLTPTWPLIDLGLGEAADEAERNGWSFDSIPLGSAPEAWSEAARQVRERAPGATLIGDYFVPANCGFLSHVLQSGPPTLLYSLYAPSIPEFLARLAGVSWLSRSWPLFVQVKGGVVAAVV